MPKAVAPSAARARFAAMHGEIRERICLLRYRPGMRLSEEALAVEFGVSRTPIRRVLNRLEFEGLVESRHGVGTIVVDVDLAALREVYALRMRLAELIGELDPSPRSAEDLAVLHALHRRLRRLRGKADLEAFARIDMAYTRELSRAIGNRPLRETSERLFYQTSRIWLVALPRMDWRREVDTFSQEIADTITAMEIGDFRAVGLIRRNHIAMSLHRLTQHLGGGAPMASRAGSAAPQPSGR
jgi:DNA-binding GntR family transcriptional regulator